MGKQTGRRLAMLIAGIGLMGPGIALFKLVLMGNDPHTALMIALGNWLGVDFSVVLFAVNCLWFSVEWRLGKTLIGIGTVCLDDFGGARAKAVDYDDRHRDTESGLCLLSDSGSGSRAL